MAREVLSAVVAMLAEAVDKTRAIQRTRSAKPLAPTRSVMQGDKVLLSAAAAESWRNSTVGRSTRGRGRASSWRMTAGTQYRRGLIRPGRGRAAGIMKAETAPDVARPVRTPGVTEVAGDLPGSAVRASSLSGVAT